MVYHETLKRLEQHKQLLVTQCDIHRIMLALEVQRVRTGTGRWARLLAWRHTAGRLLLPGAVAAGFLLTRRGMRRWLTKAFLGWALWQRAKPLRTVFRRFQGRR